MNPIRQILSRRRMQRDLAEEMRQHLQERIDELVESGMSYDEASAEARRRFGNVGLLEERGREVWHWTRLETLLSDIRYSVYQLCKSPIFALTAILTLAVGIGANLTAFQVAKTIFWTPVHVVHPEQLLAIYGRTENGQGYYTGIAYNEFQYYHDHNDVLSAFAVYLRIPFHFESGGGMESIIGEIVTPEFFAALPARTLLGRTLSTDSDSTQRDEAEIVLSYSFWQSHFHGNSDVLGTTVRLEGYPYRIVGVVGPEFSSVLMDWQQEPQFWVPMNMIRATPFGDVMTNWKANSFMAVGRLKPGITLEQGTAELQTLDARLLQDDPARLRAWNGKYDTKMMVLPIQQARFFPAYRQSIEMDVAVVAIVMALVLVLVCLNLANLSLARNAAKQREWAVRAALGSGRLRLLRQSLIEAVLLCTFGCIAGLWLASIAWHSLSLFGRPFRVYLPGTFSLDATLLATTIGLAFFITLMVGLWPAWRASRMDVNAVLRQQSHSESVMGLRVRSILIAAQVAISLILLVGAALFVRTVENAREADGLSGLENVAALTLDFGLRDSNAQRTQLAERVLAGITLQPGVEAASAGSDILVAPRSVAQAACSGQTMAIDRRVALQGYFDLLRIPILLGHDFTQTDAGKAPAPAIINETLAQRCWPDSNPIGRELDMTDYRGQTQMQIIAVVKDTNIRGFRSDIVPTVYSYDWSILFIRVASSPTAVFDSIRGLVRQIAPEAVVSMQTIQEQVDLSLAQQRLTATLCVTLGTIAFVLTLIGIYGVIALSVTSRTREIGIRMAIGAQPSSVLTLVMKQSVVLVCVGVVLGIIGSIGFARSVSAMLYGVSPVDVKSLTVAVALMVAFALLAAWIPARRASRIDPLKALRHE